jgi:hypothetical protein
MDQASRNRSLGVAFLVFAGLASVGFSQPKVIPPDDRDLDRIILRIRPVVEFADQCSASECPKIDCAQAQDLQNRLRDARIFMRYTHYWLSRAADSQMDHLTSVAGESILASERAARVQKILAYQRFVHGMGSGLLEVASISGKLQGMLGDQKVLSERSYTEIAGLLDNLYEGMKTAESLGNRLESAKNDRDFPKPIAEMMPALGNLSSREMNDLKSTLSNIKSLMEAANKHGNDWRKVLKEGRGAATLGTIAGRYLKAYGDAQIKDRQRQVDSLLNDIIAQDAVQTHSFKDLQRIQIRRNKAEDAYTALDKLIVIDSQGAGKMTRCLMKLNQTCTSLDINYASKLNVPKHVEVESFAFVTEADKRKSWGQALLTINANLPTVERWLQDTPRLETSPQASLRLEKAAFEPDEQFNVRFTAPSCLPHGSFVAIAAGTNFRSEKLLIRNAENGTFSFKAPTEPGNYSVRMINPYSENEVTSVGIRVGSVESVEYADWLLGDWGTPRDRNGDQLIVRFIRDNDGTISGYIVALRKSEAEQRYRVGEKIFKGYKERPPNSVWSHVAVGGQCLDSNFHYMDDKGEKRWWTALIKINRGSTILDLPCVRSYTIRRLY